MIRFGYSFFALGENGLYSNILWLAKKLAKKKINAIAKSI